MKRLFALLILYAAAVPGWADAPAFPFTFYIHDTTGSLPDTPFTSIYQFGATPLGSNSHIVLKAVNSSAAAAYLGAIFVSTSQNSTVQNTNFSITGLALAIAVDAGGSFIFTVNFSPLTTGPITGYMETSYQVQTAGCSFTSSTPATQCPGGLNVSGTLTGTASEPQLVLSYVTAGGTTLLQPSGTPLNFGNVSTSSTAPITFTLSNESTVPINIPSISVPPPTVYRASPFVVDTSQLPSNPATLAAGASANFTVTYEPGQTELDTGFLIVGSNSYPIQGEGVVVADIDALQIYYVDNTGVRSLPQPATPISFGQVTPGSSGTSLLTFTVTNPATSFNAVSLSTLNVAGAAFTLTGGPTLPANIAPGASITFQVTFTAGASGSYTGTLAVGTREFSLAGLGVVSPIPTFTLAVNPSPLTSQQQATVAVQLSSASASALIGTITMTFAPSVTGVTDDPAILFIATSGRVLPINVAAGGQTATYSAKSALSFQTGTTAGTITFTVAFPNTPTYQQSYTITPAIAQITSATAVRSDPNLVVTVAGYDNTYSASQMSFTFYDTSGKEIVPLTVDETSNFKQLFFTNNQAGGTFSVQATFPVQGNVASVGSVGVTMNNTAGQANTTLTFQ